MATVSDRGQVLLLGAIVVAVTFVALSVVLSGTLFSETLTKTAVSEVGSDETRTVLLDVRDDGGTVLQSAVDAHPTSVGAQESSIGHNVSAIDGYYGRYYAQQDAAVSVDVDSIEIGRTVSQSSGSFAYDSDGDGTPEDDWSITTGQQRVRNASVTIEGGTGAQTELVFDDGTDQYTIELDANGRVAVDWPSAGTTVCTASASLPIRVDISTASVDGTRCGALDFRSALDTPYEVHVRNGGALDGSYHLTTDGGAIGPMTTQRVYAVEIAVTHRTAATDYEGTVRAAPEEIG